jgi:serine/threonine protein kinase/tetratricopeptide (TPR) repeat protein
MTERDIFIAALQVDDPAKREAYLNEACAKRPELLRQVEDLLRLYENAGSFLQEPAAESADTGAFQNTAEPAASIETPGAMIGLFKLLEQIGEGGMGDVWMAEQSEPIQRRVAVKVIKAGMDSKQVLARFDAERQALALMEHPNIARVLDAGATTTGRPYFVMELVKGTPITKFCDERKLNVRERLELFGDVCRAVQHAHQKGIIHRDIKPSNVLVAPYDGKPVVKVIDFGVAKATGQKLTEATLFTGFGAVVGTPEYMSPEQAEVNNQDIDTRSDIYSLGVLLFELLTGSTPLTKKRVKDAAFLEILRVIREEEPPKPSTRLSSTEELPSISAQRHTEPAKLTKLVRGELDWIVMKALEKDRNRRYETANGFAMDVQRYLSDEAVLACPPSTGYRLRKFSRRNKGGLAVAALVLFFVVLLGSGAGWAMRDRAARHAKAGGQVESIFAEVDRLEVDQKWPEALAATRRAEAIVSGGEADAATAERVRERLKGLEFIDRLEHIRMLKAAWVGRSFDYPSADREYAQAFREYGADVDELAVETAVERLRARPSLAIPVAAALDDWAEARRHVAASDSAGAQRVVAVARGVDPDPVADRLRSRRGRPVAEVRAERRRLAGSVDLRKQHPETIISLADYLYWNDDPEAAVRLLRDAQRVHPGDFWLNYWLGQCLQRRNDYDGAVRFYTAALSIRPKSTAALNNLGNALLDQQRPDEAIATYQRALEVDPNFAHAHSGLGTALRRQKKLDEAISHYRTAIDLDPTCADYHYNLGAALAEQNKLDEAIAAYRKAVDHDSNLVDAHGRLGDTLCRQNSLSEGIQCYRKALKLHPEAPVLHFGLGAILYRQRKLDEAVIHYGKAVEFAPESAAAHQGLGTTLYDLNQLDGAACHFGTVVRLTPKSAAAHYNLGNALSRLKRLDDALVHYRKAFELDPKDADVCRILSSTLGQKGWDLVAHPDPKARDPERALGIVREAVEIDSRSAFAWQSLGWVRYRVGNWRGSVEALEKSCGLWHGGSSTQWVVLALAHARLAAQDGLPEKERAHHQAEARRRYEQADKEIDKEWRSRPEDLFDGAVWDLRAEARELIGAKEGKK